MSLRTYPNITHPAYLRHIEQERANQHAFDALPVDRLPTSPPKIDNVYEISDYLSVSADIIRSILIFNEKHYRHFPIKKKSGGYRQVDAPRTFLKVVQWWINDVILSRIPISDQCHGFVKGRSFATNAFEHVGCASLLNIDIKDFFPSIGINRVEAVFKQVGYSNTVCEELAKIVTYKGKLPQGAPTSPAIANIVMLDIDIELFKFCQVHNLKYTRYADDLSFSSSGYIPQSVVKYIYRILAEADFMPNVKKTRIMGPNRPKEVTGVALTSHGIGLSRRRLNKLRAKFHNAQVRPLEYSHRRDEIFGDVTFVRQIGGRGSARIIQLGDLAVSSIENATRASTSR